jgi:ABC-type spermidine/putrescine transport system permease subunit I
VSEKLHALERRALWRHRLMLAPALLFLALMFGLPLAGIIGRGFESAHQPLENYAEIFGSDIYFLIIARTFRIAATVTLICVLVGYPAAYVLAHASPRSARILMIAVIVPYFTSVIVRTYAWIVLLGKEGLVNQQLLRFGLGRAELLYNETGVLIGMAYVLLPFMIITLFTVMKGIDQGLVRAAYVLGASRFYAFRRVFLPLSLPGLAGGMMLVFILAVGFYITPALMGGPNDVTIAMLIQREVEITVNWSFASALATVLLVTTLATFACYARFIRIERLLGMMHA